MAATSEAHPHNRHGIVVLLSRPCNTERATNGNIKVYIVWTYGTHFHTVPRHLWIYIAGAGEDATLRAPQDLVS